jgi:hypothetical protein
VKNEKIPPKENWKQNCWIFFSRWSQ